MPASVLEPAAAPMPGDLPIGAAAASLGVLAGRYRLESLIGKGAIGAVYRAFDLHRLDPCAIKILHQQSLPHDAAYHRFLRESRIVADLFHPNIVEIRDFAVAEDGTPFLVMELLHGSDLYSLTRGNKRLPLAYALEVLSQAGSALESMHSLGIIHRDVKLQNLFLCSGGYGERPGGTIKLVDFGLATTLGSEQLSGRGSTLGTPEYMAPEGTGGRSHLLDAASDQWSLAVVAYRLLSGQLPFQAESPLAVELLVCQARPVPLGRHVPSLPAHVCEAVHRALSPNKPDRYPSIAGFIAALRRPGAGRPPVREPARSAPSESAIVASIPIEVPPQGSFAAPGAASPAPARHLPWRPGLLGAALLLAVLGLTLRQRRAAAPPEPSPRAAPAGPRSVALSGPIRLPGPMDRRLSAAPAPELPGLLLAASSPERPPVPAPWQRLKPPAPRRTRPVPSSAPERVTGPLPAAPAPVVSPSLLAEPSPAGPEESAAPPLRPPANAAVPARPPSLGPTSTQSRRIESCGARPRLPAALQHSHRGETLRGEYELCMDRAGRVLSIKPLRGIPGADADIIATLRTWQCEPWPVPSCSVLELEFALE